MSKLISIIIPVYNVAEFLPKCIDSIIAQTYKNIEIIFVNDGSTDNSREILEMYSANDSRITIINQENSGVVLARNAGVCASKGEYIGFVDPDDWIELNMYEHLLYYLEKYDVGFVHSPYFEEKDGTCTIINQRAEAKYNVDRENYYKYCFDLYPHTGNINGSIWNKLFKREIVEKYLLSIPSSLWFLEDGCFLISCCPFISAYYVISTPLYHYRHREGSVCRSLMPVPSNILKTIAEHLRDVFSQHPDYEELLECTKKYYILVLHLYVYRKIASLSTIFDDIYTKNTCYPHYAIPWEVFLDDTIDLELPFPKNIFESLLDSEKPIEDITPEMAIQKLETNPEEKMSIFMSLFSYYLNYDGMSMILVGIGRQSIAENIN